MATIVDASVAPRSVDSSGSPQVPVAPTSRLIPLDTPSHVGWPTVGARGERLARAMRLGLPIPAGVIVPHDCLGAYEPGVGDVTTAATLIDHAFDHVDGAGRTALMVSLSSVSPPNSAADRVLPTCAIESRSELLHTVRLLSATASILRHDVSVIVQRDIAPESSGTVVIGSSTGPTDPADPTSRPGQTEPTGRSGPAGQAGRSVATNEVNAPSPAVAPSPLRSRLSMLEREICRFFSGERTVVWAVDDADELWVIDIGPEHLPTSR